MFVIPADVIAIVCSTVPTPGISPEAPGGGKDAM
jgi:hypothetical protein